MLPHLMSSLVNKPENHLPGAVCMTLHFSTEPAQIGEFIAASVSNYIYAVNGSIVILPGLTILTACTAHCTYLCRC